MKLKKILCTAVSTVMIMSVSAVNAGAFYDPYNNGSEVTFYSTSDIQNYMSKNPEWKFSDASSISFATDGTDETFVVDCDIDLTGYENQFGVYCNLTVNEGCTLNVPDSDIFILSSDKTFINNGNTVFKQIGTYGASEDGIAQVINNNKMKLTASDYLISYENSGTFNFENNGTIMCPNSNYITQNGNAANLGTGTGIILTKDGKLTYTNDFGDTVYEHGNIPADSGIGIWQGRIGNIGTYVTDDTKTGNSDITMDAETISAPTYTVTIPKTVSFGTQQKTTVSNVVTTPATISASGVSNLFANQQKLVVTVESKNNFVVTDNILTSSNVPYEFYTSYADKTKLGTDKTILTIEGTVTADKDLSATKECTLALDTKNISKAGNFSDTMTFTIALESVGD